MRSDKPARRGRCREGDPLPYPSSSPIGRALRGQSTILRASYMAEVARLTARAR